MGRQELSLEKQYAGLQDERLHVVAFASRAVLRTVVLDPYGLRARLSRGASTAVELDMKRPHPVVAQSTVFHTFVRQALPRLVDKPLRDDALTTYVLNGQTREPRYRQRVITPQEVTVYDEYNAALTAYAEAAHAGDRHRAMQAGNAVAELSAHVWGAEERQPVDISALAVDTSAYCNLVLREAAKQSGPPEAWPISPKPLPPLAF